MGDLPGDVEVPAGGDLGDQGLVLRVQPSAGGGIGVARVRAPRAWFGRTTDDIRRARPNPSVILAIQRGEETLAEPGLNEPIREGDLLVLLCPDDKIDDIPSDRAARDRR